VTLTNGDPRLLAVTNVTTWLYGWTPQLAPNIVGQPASQSVGGGQLASFTVTATGIPDPTYQWLKNGTNLNGQTDATLTISNAYAGDAGAYSVIVSNASGTVTSTNVTLSVGNTAPTLNAISDQTVNPGETLNLPTVANDPDVPPQTLTFSLTTAPMGASIDPNTGVFTWRPSVSQANAAYPVTITVTDNGSPNLNASQSFNVIVNGVTYPAFGAVSRTGGQFSLTVDTGTVGPDYIVMASTNLVNWESIFTNSSPSLPFTFTDTNAVEFNSRFYRIQLAP
jgi:hypothetical protein